MAGYANGTLNQKSLLIASVVVVTMVFISILKKSFFRLVPVISVAIGYTVAMALGLVDF